VPAIGLLPVLVAVVLASEGVRLGGPSGQPVASGALATSMTGAAQPAVGAGVPIGPTPVAGLAGSNPTAGANGAQPNSTTTSQAAATRASDGTAQSQGTGAGASVNGTSATNAGVTTSSTSSSGGGTLARKGTAIAATSGPFRAYTVQPGDTVKFVAQMYGVSAASISQASGLRNPDYLRVGQVLTIPAQPGWLYRVQPGESLDQIAARTGVSTAIIASASNLAPDAVRAGDVVLIPDQAGAVSK
jgi:LysM repeat protein